MKFYIDKNAEVLHEDVLINVALWCYDDTIEEIWEEYNLDKDFGLVEEAYKRDDIHVNLYADFFTCGNIMVTFVVSDDDKEIEKKLYITDEIKMDLFGQLFDMIEK